jgi:hypothetical protein
MSLFSGGGELADSFSGLLFHLVNILRLSAFLRWASFELSFFFFETIERNNDRRNNSNNPKSLGISWKIGNQANDATRHTHTHK